MGRHGSQRNQSGKDQVPGTRIHALSCGDDAGSVKVAGVELELH